MKHGKRPTREQKKIIEANGLTVENWLVGKVYADRIELIHRHTGTVRTAYIRQRA